MARGVNKVILIGNLGNDPDVRYSGQGNAITRISVATSETWKDKNTGNQQEKTEWHRVVLFNRLGEIAGEYLKKGSKVYIEGKLETRKWQDQSGADRYTTEIVANEMQMLDAINSGTNTAANVANNQPRQSQPAPQQAQQQNQPSPSPDFDDDIPF